MGSTKWQHASISLKTAKFGHVCVPAGVGGLWGWVVIGAR
jgi:hypothetical protein